MGDFDERSRVRWVGLASSGFYCRKEYVMSRNGITGIQNPIAIMLTEFLKSQSHNAILVRGPWGVGKTHAICKFVDLLGSSDAPEVVARSYVSLFGKQTIHAIQCEIFSSAKQLGTDDVVRVKLGLAAHKLMQLEKYVGGSRFERTWRWMTSKIGRVQAPWIGELGAMMSQGNYGLVDGFLVTIDDLERRAASVSLKDTLGIIDELASRRNCKVIAICNEDALDSEDSKLLATYKEKVFDLEVLFSRTPREIASIGLPGTCSHRELSMGIFEKLGISNIRVAKRYAFLVDQVWPDLEGADPRIVREVCEHVAILTWAKYDSTADIPSEKIGYLASESSWMASAISDQGAEKPPWEQSWEAAAEALEFSSEAYDAILIEYLRTGIWAPGALRQGVLEKGGNLKKLEAVEALRSAWRLYSESFDPDKTAFVGALVHAIGEYVSYISPRDADSAFRALEDLSIDFGDLADRYIDEITGQIEAAQNDDWLTEELQSKALQPLVQEIRSRERRFPTIDAALERVSIERSWSEEDILALDACSEDDLFEWMMSAPASLPTKIRRGLLFLGSQTSDARYVAIGEKTRRALDKVAGLSDLNRIRVRKMFDVAS